MVYVIKLGIPEIKNHWDELVHKNRKDELTKEEVKLYRKWGKAMALLANNPKHPGLQSHEIEPLTQRYGLKVWQSYLENQTPGAGRIYWVYGPGNGEITVIGLEPHPEDRKKAGYAKVRLSGTGDVL